MAVIRKKNKKISRRSRQRATGGTTGSAQVFSYHSKDGRAGNRMGGAATVPSRHLGGWWRHIPALFAAVAILASFGYILTLNSNVSIVSLNSAQNPLLREQKAYKAEADKLLGGSITAKTKLTINTASFNAAMRQKFPELSEVSVTLPLMGHRPIVELGSSIPAFLLSSRQGKLYVIDDHGKAVIEAKDVHNIARWPLLVIQDQSNVDVTIGKSIITSGDVSFIKEVVSQLQAKGLKVSSIILPTVANEVHMKLDGQPYTIKFNTGTNARQAAGAFLALKQKLEAGNITPNEYIDMRVEEKAYYK